jgi:hypothetical protein
VWIEPYTLFNILDAGGFHTAPVLGEAGANAASCVTTNTLMN